MAFGRAARSKWRNRCRITALLALVPATAPPAGPTSGAVLLDDSTPGAGKTFTNSFGVPVDVKVEGWGSAGGSYSQADEELGVIALPSGSAGYGRKTSLTIAPGASLTYTIPPGGAPGGNPGADLTVTGDGVGMTVRGSTDGGGAGAPAGSGGDVNTAGVSGTPAASSANGPGAPNGGGPSPTTGTTPGGGAGSQFGTNYPGAPGRLLITVN